MMPKQKYFRGHKVRICKELPGYMRHFESDKDAIVIGSYTDLCGGSSAKYAEYSLLILKPKPHSISWYEENQLSLIDNNRDKGEEILQKYKGK